MRPFRPSARLLPFSVSFRDCSLSFRPSVQPFRPSARPLHLPRYHYLLVTAPSAQLLPVHNHCLYNHLRVTPVLLLLMWLCGGCTDILQELRKGLRRDSSCKRKARTYPRSQHHQGNWLVSVFVVWLWLLLPLSPVSAKSAQGGYTFCCNVVCKGTYPAQFQVPECYVGHRRHKNDR